MGTLALLLLNASAQEAVLASAARTLLMPLIASCLLRALQ